MLLIKLFNYIKLKLLPLINALKLV